MKKNNVGNNNGKFQNNGGNKNFHNNYHSRENNEDFAAKKAAQIEMQKGSLEIIEKAAAYMDKFLTDNKGYKITMRDVLTYLNDECGYDMEKTRVISQFNYLMMDLANARKNPHISGDRLNIRVLYIEERMKTSFKKELHDTARDIIKKYSTLFHWDAEAKGENYTTLPERK